MVPIIDWIRNLFIKELSEEEQKERTTNIEFLKQTILKKETKTKNYKEMDFLVDARPNIQIPKQKKEKGIDFLLTE